MAVAGCRDTVTATTAIAGFVALLGVAAKLMSMVAHPLAKLSTDFATVSLGLPILEKILKTKERVGHVRQEGLVEAVYLSHRINQG
jgi:hypothetical protein